MSSRNFLAVHQCDDVVFDDLAALNKDLAADFHILELLEFDKPAPPEFIGWVNQTPTGEVQLTSKDEDFDFTGYRNKVLVWGCWSTAAANIIASHMTSGKLVFRLEQEGGWPDEYTVMTPGKVERVLGSPQRF